VNCSCGDFGVAVERQFAEQIAVRDLESYRAKGPGATTRLLRDGLTQAGRVDGVLLDIGAGVGALTFELLNAGVTRAIAVDASPAYVRAASREAARRGKAEAIQFIRADFISVSAKIPPAAIVTLDRVVCCYPESLPLLAEGVRHAERLFGFSYPRDLWYVRIWNIALNAKRRLTGNPFRTYIHAATDMAQVIKEAGFNLVCRRVTWTWSVDVYARAVSQPK
jgi:magnesium-protoporphyrin O-methyltransferase